MERNQEPDTEATDYEAAISELCPYVKHAMGIQEQLPSE